MTSNVLCKYYMNGACAYGDQCRFSHNKQDEPSQVCRYYLAGNCAYGDRCRYMHSKPNWSGRGQPPPPSNYTAPTGVPKPATGGPEAAPNWEDFMTPDEMDEFEQWQDEQQMKAEGEDANDGDIMDPADIPLCQEYAGTGQCSAGDDCLYIHGDECEICGYYCAHPYNPDWTAQHQAACRQHLAAAAAANGTDHPQPPPPQQEQQPGSAAAAAADGDLQPAVSMETSSHDVNGAASAAAANGAAAGSSGSSAAAETPEAVKATVAAAVAAVVAEEQQEQDAAAADSVADKLAATDISS